MEVLYPLCKFLQGLTLKIFSNYEVVGRENVPPMGPLVIVCNHMSNIDPSILSCSLPRRLRFLAKKSLFSGFPISQMLKSYGAHPINRNSADIAAIKWSTDILSRDGALVVFPEGTRNGGKLIKGKNGVSRLIQMTGATILPVGMTGTQNLDSLFRVVNPTGKITVNIGTAFSLPPIEGKIDKPLLESMTNMIMQRISALLPGEYRGIYNLNQQRP